MIPVAELDNIARARLGDAKTLLAAGRFDVAAAVSESQRKANDVRHTALVEARLSQDAIYHLDWCLMTLLPSLVIWPSLDIGYLALGRERQQRMSSHCGPSSSCLLLLNSTQPTVSSAS